jgi:hypothetical protein
MALDFTTAILDSRVTFTRSGNTATVVNSSGFIAAINANLPRFDHDPTTLVCKGLLIEEARTNIALDSNNFSAATWTKTNLTVTPNAAVSPDGTSNASLLTATTADGALFQTMAATTATVYTYSIYLRADTTTSIRLFVDTSGLNTFLSTLISVTTSWQRFTFSFTTTGVGCKIYVGGGSSFSTPETVYVYGAQLEVGAFATSYIPTTASQVTRTADTAVMTGTNFSNWYNASEGAVCCEFQLSNIAANNRIAFDLNDNGTNNRFVYRSTTTSGNDQLVVRSGGVTYAAIASATPASASITKISSCYKINNFGLSKNAADALLDTAGDVPIGNSQIIIGSGFGSSEFLNGYLRKLNYYKQRLINAELAAFSK